MLTLGNRRALIHSQARVDFSGDRWARPFSSRISSLKFSTPRLSRVTPSSLSVCTLGSESVPGSHSNVTSSA